MRNSQRVRGTLIAWAAGLLATTLLVGCSGDTDEPDAEPDSDSSAGADAVERMERAMSELDDFTFRGAMTLPMDSDNALAGREGIMTQRVTRDGSCETSFDFGGGVTMTRRTIAGTMYQQYSPGFLEISAMDPATKDALRGRWTAQPDDPVTTCDPSRMSESVDLDTIREIGADTVRGRATLEYESVATTDARLSVRIWIAEGDQPLLMRIAGGMGGVEINSTLISYDDGFTIDEPPASSVVQPSG